MSFLGGGSTPQVNYTPSGFVNPTGFSVSGAGSVTESPVLTSARTGLSNTFQQGADAFANLGATVAPGFSAFRKAGLQNITNTFRQNFSNLKDTLAQRRVLGSSFANSQFSQAYADEAQAKANFEASAYQQEFADTTAALQAQYTMATNSFTTAIQQSNIESGAAANLVATNNQINANIASANAQLMAQNQAGQGAFFGSLINAGASLGGSYMTSSSTNALAAALIA